VTLRYLFQKYDFLLTQSDSMVSIDVSTGNQPGENTENTMTFSATQSAAPISTVSVVPDLDAIEVDATVYAGTPLQRFAVFIDREVWDLYVYRPYPDSEPDRLYKIVLGLKDAIYSRGACGSVLCQYSLVIQGNENKQYREVKFGTVLYSRDNQNPFPRLVITLARQWTTVTQ